VTVDFTIVAIISLAIGATAGIGVGYGTVRLNQLLVVVLGKAWSSGRARQRYILISIYAAIVYFIILAYYLYPDQGYVAKAISVPVFVVLFLLGVYLADKRYGASESIMFRIIEAMYDSSRFAEGDSAAAIRDACRTAKGVLEAMPKSNSEILRVLFLVFDSRTAVFFVSLSAGEAKFARFVELKPADQIAYIRNWIDNPFLFYAMQGLKSLVNFSYYSNQSGCNSAGIPYDGNFLRRTYLE
jgi:hypothetical protein